MKIANTEAVLALKPGQTPKVVVYDTDMKNSVYAMASINAAASALNASVLLQTRKKRAGCKLYG